MKKKNNAGSGGMRGNFMLTLFSVILCVAVIITAVLLWNGTPAAVPVIKDIVGTIGNVSDSSTVSSTPSSSLVSSSPQAASSTESSSNAASSAPVVTAKAGEDYEKPFFIGDSYTDGLTIYCGLDKDKVFASNTMTTYSAIAKKYSYKSQTLTAADAAKQANPKGIFVMLGSNDCAQGYSVDKYVVNYKQLLTDLKAACPNANIYIESVLPVSAAFSDKNKAGGLNNTNIKKYNEALKSLAESENVNYLDIASVLCESEGVLPAKLTSDGYHLRSTPYGDWIDFIQMQR